MTNVVHKFFSMYLFLFITLYMFRAHGAHHQERQIVSIQPLVTVIICWWPRCVQVGRSPAHISATNIEWLLPEAVLIQFVSPDDEHDVLETCRESFHQPTLMHNFLYSLTICLLHYYPRYFSSITDAVWIQFFLLKMGMLMLETCWG